MTLFKISLILIFSCLSILTLSQDIEIDECEDSIKRKDFWSHVGLNVGYNYSKSNLKLSIDNDYPIASTYRRNNSLSLLYYTNYNKNAKFSIVSELGLNNISYDLSGFKYLSSNVADIITSTLNVSNIFLQSGLKYSIKKFNITPSFHVAYSYKTSIDDSFPFWRQVGVENSLGEINMYSKFQLIPQISIGLQTKAFCVDYRFYRTVNRPFISSLYRYNYYGMGIRLIIFPKVFFNKE